MIQYNNFMMKREQSRAGSRFAECEKSRLKAKILITLALLLTAVTGAWATDGVIMKELTVPSEWNDDNTFLTVDEMTGFKDFSSLTEDEAKALVNSVPTGKVLIIYGAGASSNSFKLVQNDGVQVAVGETPLPHSTLFSLKDQYKYYYTTSDAIEVNPVEGKTNEWTFSMPGSDVVLTPQYAPAAKWATEGDAVLAPTAIEGVIAGTTDPLIIEGTVAAGQGTVMYAVTTTNTTAPALSAFSSELPTAANIADDGATVYVWYYIAGADTPQGEEPTAENTFNDSEICAQPLEVIVLSNKFDITFNAANANTIEAGKATVKVGDAAATVTEGKLQGVKMGTKVTINAKQGYKFRKVEVKKGGAAAEPITVTINQSDWESGNSFTKDGVTVSAGNIDHNQGNLMMGGSFSTSLGNFTSIVVTSKSCNASGEGWSSGGAGVSTQTWSGTPASSVSFSGEFMGMNKAQTTIVCTIVPAN